MYHFIQTMYYMTTKQKELENRYNILYPVLRILSNALRNPSHITNLLLFQLHIGIKYAILELLKERLFV